MVKKKTKKTGTPKTRSFNKTLIIILIITISIELVIYTLLNLRTEKYVVSNSTNPEVYAQEFKLKCSAEGGWRTCYGENFAELTKKTNVEYVLNVMEKLRFEDPKTQDCHILAHYISGAHVNKNPSKWKDLIKQVDITSCNYGFLHGSLEGLSRYDSNFKITADNIPNICNTFNESSYSKYTEQGCGHIMGHILLANNCSDNMNDSVQAAINVCAALPTPYQYECHAGVFMESFTRDNMVIHCGTEKEPWPKLAAEMEDMCLKQRTGIAAQACWFKISYIYNSISPNNPKFVFSKCQRAPLWSQTVECYINVAEHELIYKEDADKKYFASICAPLQKDDRAFTKCFRSVTVSIIYASVSFADRAALFCESLPQHSIDACLSPLTELLIQKTSPSQRVNVCKNLPAPYKTRCESA